MQGFTFITHDNHDPYFNLASEEYLLKQKGGYYIYLWINAPAVICGINQNALQEVNFDYTQKNNIKVVRRMTGGGAVYHDLNNVCYTVIAPYSETEENYKKFTAPVIEYLNSLGVKAEFSGRNDITVEGKKISGNAQTIYQGKILHHGTILFDTDFDALSKSLKPNKLKIESKGIKSVRARVTNVKSYLGDKLSAKEFFNGLCDYFKKSLKEYKFTKEDINAINKLVEDKYSRFEWNIGYSPKGKICAEHRFDFGIVSVNFDLIEGKMQNVSFSGDFFCLKPVEDFARALEGTAFSKTDLYSAFEKVGEYIKGAECKEIVEGLFN